MKVNLLADYRGVLTGERFYTAGEHDVNEATAVALVSSGRAVFVDAPEPEPTQPTKVTKRGTRKK